jgi:hypothetical protein
MGLAAGFTTGELSDTAILIFDIICVQPGPMAFSSMRPVILDLEQLGVYLDDAMLFFCAE